MRGYGVISKPLTNMLKKKSFGWTKDSEIAFENLKTALCTAPVLALPNFNQEFVVEADACFQGMGAVLMQQGRPIAYFSKGFSTKHLGLSIYEKEYLAIIHAIEKWRTYLLGRHFTIKTDHQSLKFLLEQKITTALQQKGLIKLLGLDFSIHYKKGAENEVVDALSRKAENGANSSCCNVIAAANPKWMEEIASTYEGDVWAEENMTATLIDPDGQNHIAVQNGILKYKNRVYIGSTGDLRKRLLAELHNSTLGGHSGQQATYMRVKILFYWPGMKRAVQEYIRECEVCQRCKEELVLSPGLLQPLSIPEQAWSSISLDFIEGLPKSHGKEVIMVVVDRLTKYSHFFALTHPFAAEMVAELFINEVYRLHGLPQDIVSDRDKIFLGRFWKGVFKQLGTKLSMSTAYHPQSDGQTERVNRCLETYLRCMVFQNPRQWNKWLALAEFWYNTNFHTSLKVSPFQALYGYLPPMLSMESIRGAAHDPQLAWLKDKQRLLSQLKDNLQLA